MRRHSTATLMGLTKKELVEYVRMAEHNQEVAEEALKQQAENVKDWMPVVRCKDCKHCKLWYPEKQIGKEATPGWYCKEHKSYRRPNDVCSDGERRNDDQERN